MQKMARTVLPFKLAATEESMTAQSGLVLLGEFAQGAGLHRWLEREMPKPGSGHAYTATEHVLPLILPAIRPISSITAKRPAGLSPSAAGWMPRPWWLSPRFPNPPGPAMRTVPWRRPCIAWRPRTRSFDSSWCAPAITRTGPLNAPFSAERRMGKLRPAMADRTINISAIIKMATSNP